MFYQSQQCILKSYKNQLDENRLVKGKDLYNLFISNGLILWNLTETFFIIYHGQ